MGHQRTIVIGDVHGCHRELEELLAEVAYSTVDRLIFVGDLINKGPDSIAVLKKARELKAEIVMGNHEHGFLARVDRDEHHPLIDQMGADLQYWTDWIRTWPLYVDDPDFLVVHAGISPTTPVEATRPKVITKIRTWDGTGEDLQDPHNPPWYEFYHGEKLIVFGHWAARGLVVRDNVIGLDTGCVYGQKLSAVILPERTIVQVQAHQTYVPVASPLAW